MEDPDNPQILFGRQWRAALYLFSAMIKMRMVKMHWWERALGHSCSGFSVVIKVVGKQGLIREADTQ